jgi:hypothetical protein
VAQPARARRVGRTVAVPFGARGDALGHLARARRLRPRAHPRLQRRARRHAHRRRPALRLRRPVRRGAACGRGPPG